MIWVRNRYVVQWKSTTTVCPSALPEAPASVYSSLQFQFSLRNSLTPAKHDPERGLKITPGQCLSWALPWAAVNSPHTSPDVRPIALFRGIQIGKGFVIPSAEGAGNHTAPSSGVNHTTDNPVLRNPTSLCYQSYPRAISNSSLTPRTCREINIKIMNFLLFWFHGFPPNLKDH